MKSGVKNNDLKVNKIWDLQKLVKTVLMFIFPQYFQSRVGLKIVKCVATLKQLSGSYLITVFHLF